MTAEELLQGIEAALAERDTDRVGELCRELASGVREGSLEVSRQLAGKILSTLKANRCFVELVRLGGLLSGVHSANDRLRRLYAQGLIDEGHRTGAPELLDQALVLLERVVADPDVDPEESDEGWGLIGRIHKQFYIAAGKASAATMKKAVDAYARVWDTRRSGWHGINLVALLMRAERDGLSLETEYDPVAIARGILERIEERIDDSKADLWDLATAMEACVALGEADGAIEKAEAYIARGLREQCREFEFASTLRQLREVWRIDPDGPVGSVVLPLLEAAVLDRGLRAPDGSGSVQLEAISVARLRSPDVLSRLERVHGTDSFVPVRWLTNLFDRLSAIGSVSTRSGRGVGTGFVLRGSALSEDLPDEWYFVTNSHVITNDESVFERLPPDRQPCRPEDALIEFEVLSEEEYREFGVAELVWTSPPEECDVSILRLQGSFWEDGVKPYPVSSRLPEVSTKPRLYIAGHPGGGSLQISIHDNHLIEFDDTHMQYRTPTNPGSSGSPVFDDEWTLVGVHHAGSSEISALDGSGEKRAANQGVRLSAILAALALALKGRATGGG